MVSDALVTMCVSLLVGRPVTKTSTRGKNAFRGKKLTAYLAHIISPKTASTLTNIPRGAIVVDEEGKIVEVGEWFKLKRNYDGMVQVIDYGQKIITPGFVDLHLHLPQITQTARTGKTLLGWLDSYVFPAEARFADKRHARKIANWFFDELARNGTTLANVFTTVHKDATDIAFEIAAAKGHRVIMGKVLMDKNSPKALTEDTETSLKDAEELCKRWHGYDNNRLIYAFIPRFAITASKELLTGCGKLWKKYKGTYLHTHLAETKDECTFVKKQYPSARSYVDVYASHNLTGKNSIFAHSIYLDDKDLRALKESQSSLAHCASANFFLKSGFFPFSRIKKAGIKFGLGSDVAGGPQMSLFSVMKDTAYMQMDLWISPRELFYLGTLGGAKAANLDKVVGSLEEGKEADFVVIDPTRRTGVPNDMLGHNVDEILSTLIYLGDDRMIVSTFVRGRKIFDADKTRSTDKTLRSTKSAGKLKLA